MKFNALVNLLCDAFFGQAVGGVESIITAIGASPGTQRAVAVWAGKPGVDAEFLKAASVLFYTVAGIGIDRPVVTPRIGVYVVVCQFMLFLRWSPRNSHPFGQGHSA